MKHNPCILIVYSTFGAGHIQAAESIRQSLIAQGVDRVYMVDLLAEAHPYWNAVSRFAYLNSSVYFPRLYGFSYDVTNQTRPDPNVSRIFHSIGMKKLREIVRRLKPDAVIHTFPYLAMSELSGRLERDIPTFTVITDYVLHSRWVHPDTDRYFVATERLKQSLTAAGIEENRIAVTGIPIRGTFDQRFDKEALRAKLGLDPGKKYALISAGAFGVQSNVSKMVQTVLDHSDCDIVLVCGKNRRLRRKMESDYGFEPRVRILGFVEKMEEWMAVSWCLLSKAGAITLTEALSLSLPVIVYRPLPGQEKGNAQVLSELGALHTAGNAEELAGCLRMLEQDPTRRRMVRGMEAVYRQGASERIAAEVLQTLGAVTARQEGLAVRTTGSDARRLRTN